MSIILIMDDDPMMNEALTSVVESMGHRVHCAFTIQEGLNMAQANGYDLVFLDVNMPDGNGLDFIERIKDAPSNPEVIIITAFSNSDGARLAIENGGWDYIQKASSLEEMTLPLIRALQYRKEKGKRTPVCLNREKIIGNSLQMKKALHELARAAGSSANVLIQGQTGTGKEIFARTIHDNSKRSQFNFVVVDCASLPESLVESILFGHEKGAFTGADKAREGLIAQAHEGTLFLDEIGELPLKVQKSFLRVLQEKKYRPIGSSKERSSDFRLIAATNRNLDDMVRKNRFRSDLLFRLQALKIHLPALKERRQDIKQLFQHYMNELCELKGTTIKGYSPDFFEALTSYDWPGNVRELINVVEHVIASTSGESTLFAYHLPTCIRIHAAEHALAQPIDEPHEFSDVTRGTTNTDELPTYRGFRRQSESRYLQKLITVTRGDKKQACKRSGLSRAHFYQLLKDHNIR